MEMFAGIFYIVASVWLFYISFVMNTNNFISLIVLRIIPFVLGLASVFLALNHYGFVIAVPV